MIKSGIFCAKYEKNVYLCIAKKVRGVAQLVSAPRSGRGGRKFESSHPDFEKGHINRCVPFFIARCRCFILLAWRECL